MPHRISSFALLVLAGWLLGVAPAPENTALEPATARRLLEGLGVRAELAALGSQALERLEAGRARVAPADRDRLRAIVRQHFAADRLLATALEELLRRARADHAHSRGPVAGCARRPRGPGSERLAGLPRGDIARQRQREHRSRAHAAARAAGPRQRRLRPKRAPGDPRILGHARRGQRPAARRAPFPARTSST